MSVWLRDVPKSFGELTTGWVSRAKNEYLLNKSEEQIHETGYSLHDDNGSEVPIRLTEENDHRNDADTIKTAAYAGLGLYSDGYINNSIGTISTCLSTLYPKEYGDSHAISNVSAIAFVGIIVGQLSFGYISDKLSRKTGMLISNFILIIFAILCSGSWGKNGSIGGMLAALTAYRFFIGIGIGSEYPTGSVASAEASAMLPAKSRNRYFIWFTNFAIDAGFVISSIVPVVLLCICGEKHLEPVWRITLGLGAVLPFILLILRTTIKDSDNFKKTKFKNTRIPYWSVFKFYWFRLICISIIWFVYDFSAYAFGIYSSTIINIIIPDEDLYKTMGWNVIFNLFYIPGAFLGAISADFIGPRLTLVIGLLCQVAFGFALGGALDTLKKHVAGFTVMYGIFMTFGEFGPGDQIGLLASKTSATPIRGTYYSICAAIGKVGGFVGTYIFPVVKKKYGLSVPYYVASALALFAAVIGLFFLPDVSPTAMIDEDKKFLAYLQSTGYDMSLLGEDDSTIAEPYVDSVEEKKNAIP